MVSQLSGISNSWLLCIRADFVRTRQNVSLRIGDNISTMSGSALAYAALRNRNDSEGRV